ncbi:N-6 DNA methylase [bacterium]|jgi:type I restriction enzyme M protein|nr:N-6 DNA methylase [bacterium]MBT6831750.1 N-6 DNA methylase [bacterium]MBT6996573.1 N-6 DNA methylase [bacterium]MBT7772899.1 N-6 DNA methylase [bacterium]
MPNKQFLQKIGFLPKEGTLGIFHKNYSSYVIQVNLENNTINYGGDIVFNNTKNTVQNITKAEDWVVLECIDRLLLQGYIAKDIVLEKIYPTGHGTSGRLDILVKKNGKAFLMIECKTWGKEFDKEFQKIQKDGGQLFTYFQQDRDAEYLVLYTSELESEIKYKNEIIKIEESYRETSNVKDLFERWSKFTKQNGIFDDWVNPYEFKSKALTLSQLKPITQKDSSFIFNRFLEILRHNVVSDKPNAFNKIFTLFLCKIIDENRKPEDELEFQWIEGVDDDVTFQKRLTDLYKKGMLELLSKEVTDLSDDEFNRKFGGIDETVRNEILKEFTAIRLQKNNEFAIKEVFDKETFTENAKVLKEVVELLQEFKIRYTEKQQYLSDFFELLLTTGLKQESGQFFTPVPIARFICRSIPLNKIVKDKLKIGNANDLVPTIIDYAAGSGHFLTESMDEVQKIIDQIDEEKLLPQVKRKIKGWKEDQFDWAYDYVYGIEKDYRLVKTAKVGCYLHGDGLAKVIHGDGLGSFEFSKEYKDKLKICDKDFSQDNKQFDLVISNPPYSVSAFKANLKKEFAEQDFELYKRLTDQSSEIESLFIERTKQLLKDGGIAAIILPASILTNGGIYTPTREIILKFFEIVAITELGSNTFMATGTNTVVLFLRKKNNYEWQNINTAVERFFSNLKDVTVNGIENIFSKYVAHVWEGITFEDYKTLCETNPNKPIKDHEIFVEYSKKLKFKDEKSLFNQIINIEKDKILYFILAYSQKTVLVKSDSKKTEKAFLGYEFSNRRGNEGIHSVKKGKSIDECTKLFDPSTQENPQKASTYILQAFSGEFETDIDDSLNKHISRIKLLDALTFDRADFDKSISLSLKKKIKFESKWELVKLGTIASFNPSKSAVSKLSENLTVSFIEMASVSNNGYIVKKVDKKLKEVRRGSYKFFKDDDILIAKITPCMENGKCAIASNLTNEIGFGSSEFHVITPNKTILPKYLFAMLNRDLIRRAAETNMTGSSGHRRVPESFYSELRLPRPPKDIQSKIVKEIETLEVEQNKGDIKIQDLKGKIEDLFKNISLKANTTYRLSDNGIFDISIGKRVLNSELSSQGKIPVYSANVFTPFGFVEKLLIQDFTIPSVLWGIDGDWMVNFMPEDKVFYPTDHCGVLRIKDDSKVNAKYLAYVLQKEGEDLKFSRAKRASIDRIQGIKIQAPAIEEQQKAISEIEKIETEIAKLESRLSEIPKQKEAILNKYL